MKDSIRFFCAMKMMILLLISLAKCANAQPRIVNGVEVNGEDPGGNVAVLLAFKSYACTGMLANSEWILTAGHCVEDTNAGEQIRVGYTNSTNKLEMMANTTIAETFFDPNYIELSELGLFGFIYGPSYAANDFGMIRLADPVTNSCENGFSCNADSPDIPMNAMLAYSLESENFSGAFIRDSFHAFGYGPDGADGFGTLRRGIFSNNFSGPGWRGGQYWTSFKWFFEFWASTLCEGDSGGPAMFKSYDDTSANFAVVGIQSGVIPWCDYPFLFHISFFFRLTDETASSIQSKVESTGGSCTKTDMGGDMVLHCLNPPVEES